MDVLALVSEAGPSTLGALQPIIGRTTHTGLDDFFYMPTSVTSTFGVAEECVPVVFGEHVRDYTITTRESTLFPYDESGRPRQPRENFLRRAWRYRTSLASRIDFEKTLQERGLRWFDHSMFFPRRFKERMCISFANVSTHNHFSLSRSASCFTAHSPVIVLPGEAGEKYLALLGVLNSSIACFWLKENSHDKGNRGGERSTARYAWESYYEFTGGTVHGYPLPSMLPALRGQALDDLAQQLCMPVVTDYQAPAGTMLAEAHAGYERTRSQIIAVQEELDWEMYRLYGLIDENLTYNDEDLPGLTLGERAFEIAMARDEAPGEDVTAGLPATVPFLLRKFLIIGRLRIGTL